MRKIVIVIFITSLLSWLLAIANGCKTTKHIARTEIKTDSIAAHVIDSTVTSEISHIEKDLAEHSEIKNDQSEKVTVTTTEDYLPDPNTGAPKLAKRKVKIERKKNNIQKKESTSRDQSHIDIKKDSSRKKDSAGAIAHRNVIEKKKDVKKKTPLGVYVTIGAIAAMLIASAFLFLYIRRKKNPAVETEG